MAARGKREGKARCAIVPEHGTAVASLCAVAPTADEAQVGEVHESELSMPAAFSAVLASLGIPNWITLGRLALACVLFVILSITTLQSRYELAFLLFLLAVGSDWVDGYVARRFGWTSPLGRMLDPFVDKILICGTLIFLVSEPVLRHRPELLQPWMVVVVISRELLVTAMRGWAEQHGQDFSAQLSGKAKMVVQSIACAAGLLLVAWEKREWPVPAWLEYTVIISVWLMVAATVYSAWSYVPKVTKSHSSAAPSPTATK